MLMSSFATTPGNRLVIPVSRTAAAFVATSVMSSVLPNSGRARVSSGPSILSMPRRARFRLAVERRWNLDGPVLDLAGEVVELRLDVVDEPAGGGVPDPVGLQVEGLDAAREVAVHEVLDGLVDGDVNALEVGGQDVGLLVLRRRQVLVRVGADRPHVRVVGLRVGLGR